MKREILFLQEKLLSETESSNFSMKMHLKKSN